MESVLIDVDPSKEAPVPRPDSTEETSGLATEILSEYHGPLPPGWRAR